VLLRHAGYLLAIIPMVVDPWFEPEIPVMPVAFIIGSPPFKIEFDQCSQARVR
jgi:hypothetical protein